MQSFYSTAKHANFHNLDENWLLGSGVVADHQMYSAGLRSDLP